MKTYRNKFNIKYGFDKNESHSLAEISKLTKLKLSSLQDIYNKGIGAYKTNPQSVRPNVKSKEQWAMARVYSAIMGGKAAKVDANELSKGKMKKGGLIELTKLLPLTQGKFAEVDNEDFNWLNQWKWRLGIDKFRDGKIANYYGQRTEYIGGQTPNTKATTKDGKRYQQVITLGKQIMGIPYDRKLRVEHIDGNKLNAQKSNLRIATINQINYGLTARKEQTSKYLGVSYYFTPERKIYDKRDNRYYTKKEKSYWKVSIQSEERKYQKLFPYTPEGEIKAAKFYNSIARRIQGQFAKLNDIKYKQGGLIAPNGKKSNLTDEQYKLVRTPAFKNWFGDWENSPETASKILDDNGEPLVCYHGSNNDFNEFRSDVGYSHDKGFYGRGFYFTFNPDSKWMVYAKGEAGYYGSKIKDFFIQSFSPFDISELSKYKGVRIGYVGTESIVFLSNIAKMFPQLSDKIEVEQKKWNKVTQEYDFIDLPISVLSNLIEEYSKKVKTFITEDNWGNRNKVSGYVKAEIVEYDDTNTGGSKGSFESIDTLGTYDNNLKKEEIEILLIVDAIEKYDGIEARYQPEGYVTRFPEITDAIKENHDSILQTKYGDELVVFKPTQIKLADGTNTTFDANNNDIRYKEGGATKTFTYTIGGL